MACTTSSSSTRTHNSEAPSHPHAGLRHRVGMADELPSAAALYLLPFPLFPPAFLRICFRERRFLLNQVLSSRPERDLARPTGIRAFEEDRYKVSTAGTLFKQPEPLNRKCRVLNQSDRNRNRRCAICFDLGCLSHTSIHIARTVPPSAGN